jgi:glycosyltransferase involved in cell wall biosynthesis
LLGVLQKDNCLSLFLQQFCPAVVLPLLGKAIGNDLPKPFKVLHLASGNLYGGIEKILTTFAKNQEYSPEMLQDFAVCFNGRLRNELLEAKVTVHDIGSFRYSRPWSLPPVQKKFAEILKSGGYDAVIFYGSWQYVALVKTAKKAGCRCVFWAMNYFGSGLLDWFAKWSKPHVALACSRDVERTISSFCIPGRHQTIFPPLDSDNMSDLLKIRSRLRSQFNVRDNTKIILMASRLDPYKGHRLLVTALGKLLVKIPEGWEVWMAGGVQRSQEMFYLRELQTLAKKVGVSDKIRWLGQRSDPLELMATADLFCHPNQGPEPFGVVFLEAQSMGCPVITTAMGGALEAVEDNGINTLLAKPCPDLLAQALEKHLLMPGRYAVP